MSRSRRQGLLSLLVGIGFFLRPAAASDPFVLEIGEALPTAAPPVTRERTIELRAAPAEIEQAGRTLAVWAYDGTVPGPILRVRLGERVRVRFRNDLPQPTTLHWHGVRVPNAMDGVPGVTQPPIPPGGSFVYDFVPKDAGTFWFHPHVRGSEQVERGLYGVLVVDEAEPLPWSRDVVWVLDDWLLDGTGQVYPEFNTRRDLAHDGRWGNRITVDGSVGKELSVRAGERIRLRLVNTANGRVFAPDFGELDARVIAVDGMLTAEPLAAEGFELAPGNRLDLDVGFPTADRGRTFGIVDRFIARRPITLATIRVLDEMVPTPDFEPPSNPAIPVWAGALARPVDHEYRLNARRGGPYGIEWTINGRVWGEHQIDALPAGRWARIRFTNESFRLHPMHLHGQFFRVLARNGKPVDEPYFRDTVLLRRKETVDVGMVPLDWGTWALHCHILEHAEAGMMTAVEVGASSASRSEDAPGPAETGHADGARIP